MMPKVETFEANIIDEIKRKDASLQDISAASNNVGNDPIELPKQKPIFLIVVGSLFVVFLCALAGILYFYYTDSLLPPSQGSQTVTSSSIPKTLTELTTLSPTLGTQIGRFVKSVEKKDQGYILTLTEYSPVFAYITRNEEEYMQELAKLFPEEKPTAEELKLLIASTTKATTTEAVVANTATTTATTTPKVATSTKVTTKKTTTKTLTKVATSTKLTSSSSVEVATKTPEIPTTSIEGVLIPQEALHIATKDITISNQNMRVWTGNHHRIVYAFVGNTTLLISNSPEGILALKGAILK